MSKRKNERVEVAPDLTEEQLAWIAESERKIDELERRVEAGEDIDISGWQTENWQCKTRGYAPDFTCFICRCDMEPEDMTVVYWESEYRKVILCPEHKDYRDHTCHGMTAAGPPLDDDFGNSRGLLCDACGKVIDQDAAVWATDSDHKGIYAPYHPECVPSDERPSDKKTPTHEFQPLCSKCGEVASTFQLFNELGKWRLVFEGSAAGTGSSGDEIADERARAIIAGFSEPYSPQHIRAAGFFDDGGYCLKCCKFYCSKHWHISTTGGGTCPKGHSKILDPHWWPEDDDI
jgi:hypothetical protein